MFFLRQFQVLYAGREIDRLYPGDFFGEIALTVAEKRVSTCENVCGMTHLFICGVWLIFVTLLVQTCDIATSCMWHSYSCMWYDSFRRDRPHCTKKTREYVRVTWLMHLNVCHDSSICVTWLVHMCDMTRSHVWYCYFMYVPCLLSARSPSLYGVATISRLTKNIGLFCKRAL